MRDTVLSQAVLGSDTFLKKAALIVAGSLFIAIAAQVTVPFFPVPMTLQTLAVLLVGATFGMRMGGATLVAYLAEGAMGLPVFAKGGFGIAALMGPSGGYLFGFVLAAVIVGGMLVSTLFTLLLLPSLLRIGEERTVVNVTGAEPVPVA